MTTRTELIERLRGIDSYYEPLSAEENQHVKEAADMLEADGEQVQRAYDEGVRRSERHFDERVRMHKEEARAYKELYFKLAERIVNGKAFEPPPPIVIQTNDKLKEAARLALDALINGRKVRNGEGGTEYQPPLEDAAIAALKESL